ncbi:MAG TPA: hypothetical protein PK977_01500 [Chitinophagaceae bacterium]|nr:hypothetical protein [Chitinophagaceae bacterium]
MIDKLDIQRKFQNETFYKRLEIDLQKGCIPPAITIAFIKETDFNNPITLNEAERQINDDISTAFILDGIQRLNTIKRIVSQDNNELDLERYLYVNIIICPSRDNLLYRMVTLNNGQKPMTARHQIEILAESIYDFSSYHFQVFTEKENADKKEKGFKKADIINAYISFLSNSTSLDNKKIIEDKLDELVARKIIESKITDDSVDFNKVLKLVGRMYESESLYNWLKNSNNLIGFSVGIRNSYIHVNALNNEELEIQLSKFEKAFKNINVSTIKLSRERRRLTSFFINKLHDLIEKDSDELTLLLAEQI